MSTKKKEKKPQQDIRMISGDQVTQKTGVMAANLAFPSKAEYIFQNIYIKKLFKIVIIFFTIFDFTVFLIK